MKGKIRIGGAIVAVCLALGCEAPTVKSSAAKHVQGWTWLKYEQMPDGRPCAISSVGGVSCDWNWKPAVEVPR